VSGPGIDVDVVVVGVGVAAEDLAHRALIVLLTPAFYLAHRDEVGHFDDILLVQLERGAADIAAFGDGVRRVVPESEGAIVETTAETVGEIEDATSVQAIALIALSAAAALAGLVAIVQALSRQVAVSSVAAMLASPTTPTGFARRVEPDPGFAADWLVLGVGFVAVVVLVSATAVVLIYRFRWSRSW
jgi:hypothetical protein